MALISSKCDPFMKEKHQSFRLDTWLWATRFYKTRSLAKKQIESGKVWLLDPEGQKVKPKVSRTVHIDDELFIKCGPDEKHIVVQGISDKRLPFALASQLYQETKESIAKREESAARRKAEGRTAPKTKPDKKERRQISKFKQQY
jgi:ribosome-associated heat shock protein Hsp15